MVPPGAENIPETWLFVFCGQVRRQRDAHRARAEPGHRQHPGAAVLGLRRQPRPLRQGPHGPRQGTPSNWPPVRGRVRSQFGFQLQILVLRIAPLTCDGAASLCPTGRLSGASELGRVRVSLSGGGGVRQGHRGAVRPAQRLPEGGAAEPGQPLRPPLPRRAQDQAQVGSGPLATALLSRDSLPQQVVSLCRVSAASCWTTSAGSRRRFPQSFRIWWTPSPTAG